MWRAARFTGRYADPLTDSESEENFEDGLDFHEQEVDEDEDIAGIRRRLSDEATVSRVGEALNLTLGADIDENATPRDHFSPVQVTFPVNAPALRPHQGNLEDETVAAENMAEDFETENGQDGAKASELGRQIKVEFSAADIKFWFAELEAEMVMATIKSQYLKKTVLQRNLPIKQKEDVKSLLTLTQTEAGNDIYFKIKSELIRIYAPKAKDSYCKALTRTMVGLPSQLGNQIVEDVCKKSSKLNGCCCAAAVEALWQLQLPVGVRAHVSNLEFTHATYKQVFEAADRVYMSSKQVSVAAMASSVAAVSVGDDLDETQAAFTLQNQPEVAAFKGSGSNGGGKKKNKKNKNKNASSPSSANSSRGQKHSSVPDNMAEKMCDRHFRHGTGAWYCVKTSSCPWKDKVASKP